MKCTAANCNSRAEGDLAMCPRCEIAWRREAGEVAKRAEAGDPEAIREAHSFAKNHIRLAARALFEPLRESIQGLQPRPNHQPQPAAESGLAEAMKETQ